jgi:hypothetical protein
MAQEHATCTYRIDEPFAGALKSLRAVLVGPNLRITHELDLSARIRRALMMNIPPCVVLLASPAARTTEELASDSDPWEAALSPLHIVLSARGSRTEVHFLRSLPPNEGALERPALDVLRQLQGAVSHAVEKIGMRCLDV